MSTHYDDFMAAVEDYPVVWNFLDQQCRAGDYSFSGSCAPPTATQTRWAQKTFSVGVFQWQQKARGTGLKPGKTLIRVNGLTDNPGQVYDMAMDLCRRLRDGESFPFKSVAASRHLEDA